jgi:triosephosphate isomerase (TIM)
MAIPSLTEGRGRVDFRFGECLNNSAVTKKIIAGNWKMNLTPAESVQLSDNIQFGLAHIPNSVEVIVCPSMISLSAVNTRLTGSSIKLGAQNMHPAKSGAFTGECSSEMLKAVGCTYIIIGHSERRHVLGEKDDLINQKMITALDSDLNAILCVGETEIERDQNLTFNVVERQTRLGLLGVSEEKTKSLIIAYEPVWAIGTGKTATTSQAQEVHCFIRELLRKMFPSFYGKIPIIYGGSVTPVNVESLLAESDINGVLVGGASLKADSFLSIVKAAC